MTTLLQNYTATTAIPKAYFSTAAKQGTVHLIEYATYDYTQAAPRQLRRKHTFIFLTGITRMTQKYAIILFFICTGGQG